MKMVKITGDLPLPRGVYTGEELKDSGRGCRLIGTGDRITIRVSHVIKGKSPYAIGIIAKELPSRAVSHGEVTNFACRTRHMKR